MPEFDQAMVERLRVILFGNSTFGTNTAVEAIHVRTALRALPISAAALDALEKGEAVVVPKVRTRAMLDARQVVHGFAPLTDQRWRDIESARAGIDCDDASIIDEEWRAMLAASPLYTTETKDG